MRIRGFCIHRAPGTELGFDEWSGALFYSAAPAPSKVPKLEHQLIKCLNKSKVLSQLWFSRSVIIYPQLERS